MTQISSDFTSAQMQRDIILESIERKISPQFIDSACDAAIDYLCKCYSRKSSGENITRAIKLRGICPADDRHFGVVFRRLLKEGKIIKVGNCNRARGHATSGGSVYSLVMS